MKLPSIRFQVLAAIFVGVMGVVPVAQAQVATSVTTIDVPAPNFWSIRPKGLNDSGVVAMQVGGSSQAHLWDPVNGLREIGGIGAWVDPAGINNQGVFVGLNLTSDFSHNQGLLWDATNGWRVMQGFTYNGGPAGVFPRAINNNGVVTGGSWAGNFIYSEANGPTFLPDFLWTRDINDAGQVVGTDYSGYDAFVWDATNGMRAIGDLGGGYSDAYAINNRGQIVGTAFVPDKGSHAFLWDPVNGMRDLGSFGAFGDNEWGWIDHSIAFDINDHGQVVGISSKSDGTFVAFIWDAVNGMRELVDTSLRGARPTAINNNGQIAGEYSASNGHARAFFATVPLPPPPTPQGQTEAVANEIEELIESGALTEREGSAVTTVLDQAIASLDRGNTDAASNQLTAAINRVNALVNAGRLTAAQGQEMRSALQAIIDEL